MDKIGDRLDILLKNKGLTRYHFCKNTGISQSTLSRIVNKNSKPSRNVLNTICNYFNVTEEWLLTGKDTNINNSAFKPKYEYEVITFDNFDAGHQQRYLNERSQQGWELISAVHFTDTDGTPCFRFYFKRKV